jgi:predicted enzyme related to lactoylglutathione lyase
MTEVTRHAPGSFCWLDLSTTDPEGARKFYSQLFNWGMADVPVQDMKYTLIQLKGKDIGGLAAQMKEQRDMGVPPNWTSYVSVTSASQAAEKAASLGGKVLVPAFDVMDHGRMAVIQDPTGAVFAVWEPKSHIGASFVNEPGALCWNELMTTNTDVAGRFYTQLFGWKSESMPMGPGQTYTLFKNGDVSTAGMMAISPEMGPVPPNWMPYFMVENTDAKVAEAKKLGGQSHVPPTDVPNVGRFSILMDPQGAAFAVITMK